MPTGRLAVLLVGLVAAISPFALFGHGGGWSLGDLFFDVFFIAWFISPFLLVIWLYDRLIRGERVVLTGGLALATVAFEIAVIRDESSTAAIALLFLPIYLLGGMAILLLVSLILRRLR